MTLHHPVGQQHQRSTYSPSCHVRCWCRGSRSRCCSAGCRGRRAPAAVAATPPPGGAVESSLRLFLGMYRSPINFFRTITIRSQLGSIITEVWLAVEQTYTSLNTKLTLNICIGPNIYYVNAVLSLKTKSSTKYELNLKKKTSAYSFSSNNWTICLYAIYIEGAIVTVVILFCV